LSRKTTCSKNGGLLKKGKAIYGIGKKKSQILHLALFKTEIEKIN
jgi:hypothetical protein